MTQDKKRNRASNRVKNFDYSSPGFYFLTICTDNRFHLFGKIVRGQMRLNRYGEIASEEWLKTEMLRENVRLDEFVIMPDHVHAIIQLIDTEHDEPHRRGTARRAPASIEYTQFEQFGKPTKNSIPTIVRSYKSAVTRKINICHGRPGNKIWQRNYYERIIREETSLNRIREYIRKNPENWKSPF
ncbi:MAG: transposase [Balneolaceae bacterium]|nr:transposase [Balneolaceae bacterium]